ncbi:MAG: STAS domain-containing protein [Xanthomonadales bacterium]|nr:STAS domain-containing protein [Xanthomonadales bacterium]
MKNKLNSGFEIHDGKINLQGDLTLSTVKAIYQKSLPLAKLTKLPELIDLRGVNRVDSSGLALLLEWQSWAVAHDHRFCYCNVPDKLLKLASLCGATFVLNMVCCADEN